MLLKLHSKLSILCLISLCKCDITFHHFHAIRIEIRALSICSQSFSINVTFDAYKSKLQVRTTTTTTYNFYHCCCCIKLFYAFKLHNVSLGCCRLRLPLL